MPPRAELSPFSYAVLTLVGAGGAGPHDIVRMMRQGAVYWSAAESHYYAEPKRLEALGYLLSRKEPGRTRERTHYELTDKGRDALRRWAREPSGLPRMQNEAIVRVLGADLVDPDAIVQSMAGLRADIAAARRGLDTGDALVETLPHRARQLRLIHRLGRRIVDAHEAFADEVEAEFGRPR